MIKYPDNVLTIPNATPEKTDAPQYFFHRGRKQFNMCGELAVAFCMQDEAYTDNIDDFLTYWEAKSLKWYETLFKDKLARTTGIYDLNKMIEAYDVTSKPLNTAPMYPVPYEFFLTGNQLIIGVQIDRGGYLVGKGIPHWVVLDKVTAIDDTHAICDIYNPFTNALEPYSWRELMTSTGSYKQGVWIER